MNNLRLHQLAQMYAYISGGSQSEAIKNILSTKTGKAIRDGNPLSLYEQQTSNLYSITRELPLDIQKKFTKEAIVKSYERICRQKEPVHLKFYAAPGKKKHLQSELKKAYKRQLKAMSISSQFKAQHNGGV